MHIDPRSAGPSAHIGSRQAYGPDMGGARPPPSPALPVGGGGDVSSCSVLSTLFSPPLPPTVPDAVVVGACVERASTRGGLIGGSTRLGHWS